MAALYYKLGLPQYFLQSLTQRHLNSSQMRHYLHTAFIACVTFMITVMFLLMSMMQTQHPENTRHLCVHSREHFRLIKRKSLAYESPIDCTHTKYIYEYDPGHDLLKWPKPDLVRSFKNPCWRDNERVLYCLPYLFLVGMAKCGTTDLFKRITLHPDFISPTIKEPGWLSTKRFYRNISLREYAVNNFKPLAEKLETLNHSRTSRLITGEGSINTLEGSRFWNLFGNNINESEPVENNAKYIRHLFPDARILINVRDPIDRLWSEYLAFSKDKNTSAEKFHKIVTREIQLYTDCLAIRTLRSCAYDWKLSKLATLNDEERETFLQCGNSRETDIVLLRRGLYHVYIRDFLKVFPSGHVLVQRLEDIKNNLTETLHRTFTFLGLRNLSESHFDRIVSLGTRNQRKSTDQAKGDMLPETRKLLYKFYKPHNKQLARLLKDKKYLYSYS